MPPRRCLDCHTPTMEARCPSCAARRRAGKRKRYGAKWQALSRQTIATAPWCAWCGSRADLTTDHTFPGVQVLCRACNGSKRDNRQPKRPRYPT